MKISGLMFAGLLTIAAVAPALGQEVKLTLSHNAAPGNPQGCSVLGMSGL